MSAEAEMVNGYLTGYASSSIDLPDCHKRQSPAFKHGWLNGRDDRERNPRERGSVLRARAEIILGNSGVTHAPA
ncbi:hypothetical protein [Stenotrophomonas sp. ATs4]|uniref:hypothetical protein n=1 Tax=Stenotrophomonas sp. ATs4 TaxID=3402766 RepID=UPI003F727465